MMYPGPPELVAAHPVANPSLAIDGHVPTTVARFTPLAIMVPCNMGNYH